MFDTSAPKAYPNTTNSHVNLPTSSSTTAKVKVVQPPTTNSDVEAVNTHVNSLIKTADSSSIWQYYKLKGVQAVPTSDETTKDYYLANIVVESSPPGIQLFRGQLNPGTFQPDPNTRNGINITDPKQSNDKFSMGGCQGCHGVAQTNFNFGFSFLFFGKGGAGFTPDTVGAQSADAMAARMKKYNRP